MTMRMPLYCSGALLAASVACTPASAPGTAATPAEAKAFLDQANQTQLKFGILGNRAGWVAQNFITDDTAAVNARISQEAIEATVKLAKDATKYDTLALPDAERRQMNVLKTSLVMVTPADPKEAEELTGIMSRLEAAYGTGQMVQGSREAGRVPEHRRDHEIMAGHATRSAARGLGGLAHDCAADEEGLRAVRRALQQGRKETGIRRHRRDVAREVRHAARRVREGARPAVDAGAAALPESCTRTCG
jgi:hypothetical protein